MQLSTVLTDTYNKFEQEREKETAPENMVAWLRSAGRAVTKELKTYNTAFESRGLSLQDELDKLADLLLALIGEEQVNSVMDEGPRDNESIKREFQKATFFLNFAVETTARFE